MKDLVLVGGGGHCKSCIDVIETTKEFRIVGIIDLKEKIGQEVLGYKISFIDEEIPNLCNKYKNFLITIGHLGEAKKRIFFYKEIKKFGGTFPVIISPFAYVSKYASIGEGTIVMHHAIVNASAKIGVNCIINNKALIEHDAIIEDHCHISTGAIINGGVKVGEGTFVGSNATSKQYIEIPKNSFIKAGSVIK